MGDGFYNVGITVCLHIPFVPPSELKLQIYHFNWASDRHKFLLFLQIDFLKKQVK